MAGQGQAGCSCPVGIRIPGPHTKPRRPGRRRDGMGARGQGHPRWRGPPQPLTTGASCRASYEVAGSCPGQPVLRATFPAARAGRSPEQRGSQSGSRSPTAFGVQGAAALPSALLDLVAAPGVARAQLSRSHRWPGRIPWVCVGVGGGGGELVLCVRLSLLRPPPPRPQVPCSIYISVLPIIQLACLQSWKRGVSPSVTAPPQGREPRGARG